MPYERLRASAVIKTAQRLERRIQARFPERNLGGGGARLLIVTADVERIAVQTIGMRALRLTGVVLIVVLVVLTVLSLGAVALELAGRTGSPLAWLQAVETTVNDLVFVGIAVGFLWLLPGHLERRRILSELHRLRSLAHVIDMHQLTKDPERFAVDFVPTPQTVSVRLTRAQMSTYLDYCSELLSLVSKTAALYAERSTDPVVLATVSDIENLTNGMSRKIWQKLAMLADDAGRGLVPAKAD